ncbi:hypothetical protein DYBT9275_02815 [Dyadobacter sp. CECT 9275]|uniref:PPM-type phosphatase domain-containing protein n=1 Tax=Dyadobacter helix TaxID=2822344 RepID=A0A916JCB0_9BACT|nr:protein phosphatase 2C domain-containing protein [Dyadobacter sp. CECT 9275]CAG5002127.1 hypothetical protein DYBT9275_02815 [Dyadobacter sp. CECT 9275]
MMKIEIYEPLALHEIGRRDNNEDNIFPEKGSAQTGDRLFVVCDGIGGNAKGEEASRIVCDAFRYKIDGVSNPTLIADALCYAEEQIDHFISQNPGAKGMGTTLTLLHLHENGATIAHVGDSRVYHIRDRTIRFVTNDHKWVNKLVLSGDLTPEEALHHPQRNVIDRAVQGRKNRPTQADVNQITDIQAGDYFFLCTDGILEGIEEDELVNILASDGSDTDKLGQIEKNCLVKSMDNYSAYLVRVESATGSARAWTSSVLTLKDDGDVILAEDANPDEEVSENKHSEGEGKDGERKRRVGPPPVQPPLPPEPLAVANTIIQSVNRTIVLAVIAVLCSVVVGGGFYLYKKIEKREKPVDSGFEIEFQPKPAQPEKSDEGKAKKEDKKKEDDKAKKENVGKDDSKSNKKSSEKKKESQKESKKEDKKEDSIEENSAPENNNNSNANPQS